MLPTRYSAISCGTQQPEPFPSRSQSLPPQSRLSDLPAASALGSRPKLPALRASSSSQRVTLLIAGPSSTQETARPSLAITVSCCSQLGISAALALESVAPASFHAASLPSPGAMETLFSTATALSHVAQSTLADAAYSTISTYEKLRSTASPSARPPSDPSSSSWSPLSSPSSLPPRRREAWTYSPSTSAGLIEGGGSLKEPTEGSTSSSSSSSSGDGAGSRKVLGEMGNQILTAARVEEKSILRFAGMSKEEVDQLLWGEWGRGRLCVAVALTIYPSCIF